jgi:hypothetical protein
MGRKRLKKDRVGAAGTRRADPADSIFWIANS